MSELAATGGTGFPANPGEHVLNELKEALGSNTGQLGAVFRAMESGTIKNVDLADQGIVANSGVAYQHKVGIRAILGEKFPKAPSLAAATGRRIGGLIRDNPDFSLPAKDYLAELRSALDEISQDASAQVAEEKDFAAKSAAIEAKVEESAGVYVYTLPTFRKTPIKVDPDRYWMKVGKTKRFTKKRIKEQMRVTGLPEDPLILRVYQTKEDRIDVVERDLHRLLIAAGHSRTEGKTAGMEWFATNLEYLDTVAKALGCTIVSGSDESEDSEE